MNFFDNAKILTGSDGVQYLGVSDIIDFDRYKNNFKIHVIEPGQTYRPDIIAYELFDDEKASWILDEINKFKHCIEEYYTGREIYYLSKTILESIGVL